MLKKLKAVCLTFFAKPREKNPLSLRQERGWGEGPNPPIALDRVACGCFRPGGIASHVGGGIFDTGGGVRDRAAGVRLGLIKP